MHAVSLQISDTIHREEMSVEYGVASIIGWARKCHAIPKMPHGPETLGVSDVLGIWGITVNLIHCNSMALLRSIGLFSGRIVLIFMRASFKL